MQVCISSTPGLDRRRAPIKDILGEKLVAMINEVEMDPSAGDVSYLIKGLVEKEIAEFVACDGVRNVGLLSVVYGMISSG